MTAILSRSTAAEVRESIGTIGGTDSDGINVVSYYQKNDKFIRQFYFEVIHQTSSIVHTWGVGSSAVSSGVSVGEDWDNLGQDPGFNDIIEPWVSLSTTPGVVDDIGSLGSVAVSRSGSGVGASNELSANKHIKYQYNTEL